MLDWLNSPAGPGDTRLALETLVFLVSAATIAGFLVAGVFRFTIVSKDRSAALLTTLILLTVITCILTLVIGSNVARAFGLVGALSIVRFRTVVEDTRETSFVIVAVVVGMAIGANYLQLAVIALIAVAVVTILMRWIMPTRLPNGGSRQLTLRVPPGHDRGAIEQILQRHCHSFKAVGVETAKQGTALELTYALRLAPETECMLKLYEELSKLDGVQAVELRENGKANP